MDKAKVPVAGPLEQETKTTLSRSQNSGSTSREVSRRARSPSSSGFV
jgi:hypothetical protein